MKKLETQFKESPLTTQIVSALTDAMVLLSSWKTQQQYPEDHFQVKRLKDFEVLYAYIKENNLDVRLVSRDY